VGGRGGVKISQHGMAGMHGVSTAFMCTSLVFARSSYMYECYFKFYFRDGDI